MMSFTSLYINPSLSSSPSLSNPPTPTSSSSSSYASPSCSYPPSCVRFHRVGAKPVNLYCTRVRFCPLLGSKRVNSRRSFCLESSCMTTAESNLHEEDEEGPPAFLDAESISKPRRIALFVEPSPFSWVSLFALHCAWSSSANVGCVWKYLCTFLFFFFSKSGMYWASILDRWLALISDSEFTSRRLVNCLCWHEV